MKKLEDNVVEEILTRRISKANALGQVDTLLFKVHCIYLLAEISLLDHFDGEVPDAGAKVGVKNIETPSALETTFCETQLY